MAKRGTPRKGSATRKIKWLAGFVIVLIAGYTALWFFLASKLEEGADQAIAQAALNGTIIECEGQDAGGYPFRLGLFCDETSVATATGVEARTGPFRSAAQIYNPGLVISEVDGPLLATTPNSTIEAQWDMARASTRFGTSQLSRGILDLTDVTMSAHSDSGEPFTAKIARVLGAVQPNGTDLDASLDVDGFDPAPVNGRDVPPLDLLVDATVSDAAGALAYENVALESLRGREVTVRSLDVALVGGGRVAINGALDVDTDGLATGALDVGFSDLSAMVAALSEIVPEYASQLEGVARVLDGGGSGAGGLLANVLGRGEPEPAPNAEAETDDGLDTNVTITLDRGRMKLGVLPIGSLPALP